LAGLALLMVFVDLPLAVWFNANVSNANYKVSESISAVGGSPIYIGCALLLYVFSLIATRRGWRSPLACGYHRVTRASLLVLSTMALGAIAVGLLKGLVARARPDEFFDRGFYGFGAAFSGHPFNSFPSSHTLTAFVIAAAVGQIRPQLRWPLLALAAIVALARLVETDHYLSDVIASACIALAIAAWLAPILLDTQRGWPLRPPWRWLSSSPA
jgi:undecaprenyl-diphosphatase